MKIIKMGDLSKLDTVRRFECPNCGTIWDADASEYRSEFVRNETFKICRCPLCVREVWREEKPVER